MDPNQLRYIKQNLIKLNKKKEGKTNEKNHKNISYIYNFNCDA